MHRSKLVSANVGLMKTGAVIKFKEILSRSLKKKKEYFENLKLIDITDNKKFWQTIKPYFSFKDQTRIKQPYMKTNHKHHKAFKFKSAYKIQYNEHRANNLKF